MSTQMTPESMAALYAEETTMAVQLRRAGVGNTGKDMPVFLHFSDIHSDIERFQRIMAYYAYHESWITEVIHTGDIGGNRFSEPFPVLQESGMEKVLNIVGNHDSLNAPEGWDWSNVAPIEAVYARYFAPFATQWGVQMQENTTYWYKDYANYSLRLIGVDCTLLDDEKQLVWLADTLTSAREQGYHVIIAAHYAPANAIPIACSFTSPIKAYHMTDPYNTLSAKMQQAVADFMSAGGEFVCYLAGHTHTDYFWYSEAFPDQLVVSVDSANFYAANYWSDTLRAFNTKTEDLFNLFSYDLENHVVKVVRVGANVNCMMQKKDCIAVDYKTMQVMK